jgi:diacylglycerol kinase family enzyme
LLINDVGALMVAIAALLVAVVLAWGALINRGPRRVLRLIPAAALLVVVAIFLPQGLAGFAGVLLLAIGSAGAARAAIGRHRPLAPDSEPQPAAVAVVAARRPVLLVNPQAGGGVVQSSGVVAKAIRRGITVVVLREGEELRDIALREVRGGATAIGVAGGDGSQATVADVARLHDIAFVCVPAGTRNHFAQDLGLDRRDPVAALAAFGKAIERRIDLAAVNGRVFVNNASMGVYAMIVQSEEYRAAKLLTAAAMLPDLVGTDAAPFDLTFVGPDMQPFTTADLLLVSNNPYAVRTFAGLAARPRLDAGELGILAVRPRTEDSTTPNNILSWTADTLRVDSHAPVALGIDGEAVELQPPLEFRALPQSLRIRMPREVVAPGAVGRAPGLRQTVSALLRIVVNRPTWR